MEDYNKMASGEYIENLEQHGIFNINIKNQISQEAIETIMKSGPLKKAHRKRGSMDQNISQKFLGKTPSKRNMASTFSLYGLTSQTSQSPNWGKLANIKNMNPGEAANKFYDKSIIKALDKYTAQEKHLKNLQNYKNEIAKLKKGGPSQTFLM